MSRMQFCHKECPERTPYCHSSCENYNSKKAEYEAQKAAYRLKNCADGYSIPQVVRNKNRTALLDQKMSRYSNKRKP